jgi:transposase InsO family protein/uncharacterized protein YacL (UPF0231 family)
LSRQYLNGEGLDFSEHDLMVGILSQVLKLYNEDNIARRVLSNEKVEGYEISENGKFVYKTGEIQAQQLLYIPVNARLVKNRIIDQYHSSSLGAHRDWERTLHAIRSQFFWRNMYTDVKQRVGQCKACQLGRVRRPRQNKPKPYAYYAPVSPFDTLHIDQKVGFPEGPDGEKAVWVVIDVLSRKSYLFPCKYIRNKEESTGEYELDDQSKSSAEELARLLYTRVFMAEGFPRKLITDRGAQFISHVWKSLMKLTGIRHNISSADHPTTNGLAERMISTMTSMLRNSIISEMLETHASESAKWVEMLPLIQFAYNSSKHPSLGNYCPFEVSMGRRPSIPLEIRMKAFMIDPDDDELHEDTNETERFERYIKHSNDVISKVRAELGKKYDEIKQQRQQQANMRDFDVGEWILFDRRKSKNDFKLPAFENRVSGPFQITGKGANDTYFIDFRNNKDFRNKSQPINGKFLFRFSSEKDMSIEDAHLIHGQTLEKQMFAKKKFAPRILNWRANPSSMHRTSQSMQEVEFEIQTTAKGSPEWKKGTHLIQRSAFRDLIFKYALSPYRVEHHGFLLNVINNRVVLKGNSKKWLTYNDDDKPLEILTREKQALGEGNTAGLSIEELKSRVDRGDKNIIVEIFGNSGDLDDNDANAQDEDIQLWYGKVIKVDTDSNEVQVEWLSRLGTSKTYEITSGEELGTVDFGTISKIMKGKIIVDTVEVNLTDCAIKHVTISPPIQCWYSSIVNLLKDSKGNEKVRILDICKGTGSISNAIKNRLVSTFGRDAFEIITIDIDKQFEPDYNLDIMQWRYWKDMRDPKTKQFIFQPGTFDLVVFSPPCTEYSVAKTIGYRNLLMADRIVTSGLEFIHEHLKPRYWFMENPASGSFALHRRFIMRNYNHFRNSVTYCRYGFPYRKLTSIWSNIPNLELKSCLDEPCEHVKIHGKHESIAQRGPSRLESSEAIPGHSREQLYKIPPDLINHILDKVLLGILQDKQEAWSLNTGDFNILWTKFGFDIEAFASKHDRHLPIYWSLKNEKESSGIDAFSQNWNNKKLYMNPPFSRLQEVVNKIKKAKNSEFTIIVPGWENEIWWDELISMVSENFGEYEKLQKKSNLFTPRDQKSLSIPAPDWDVFYFHIKRHSDQMENKVMYINYF